MLRSTYALVSRELNADVRRLAPHALRLILSLVLLLAVWSVQLESTILLSPGLTLFTWLMWINVAAGTVIVPVYLASAVGEEKEQRTLPLLLVADLSPGTILLGKLVPLLAAVGMVLLVQLPFMMLSITLGGILLQQILAAYFSLAAYVLAAAGISLLCSVAFSGSFRPVSYALCLVGALLVGPRIMNFWANTMLDQQGWGWLTDPMISATEGLVSADLFTRQQLILDAGFTGGLVGVQVIWHLLLGVATYGLALLLFQFQTRDGGEPAPVQRSAPRSKGQASRRSWRLAIAWKEFMVSGGGWTFAWAKFLAYGALLLTASLAAARGQWHRFTAENFSEVALWALLGIILPFELLWMMVRLFEPEVREQTLGTLVVLPQSTAPLVWQKCLGGLVSLSPVLAWVAVALGSAPDELPNWWWETGLGNWTQHGPGMWCFLAGILSFFLLAVVDQSFVLSAWRSIATSGLLTLLLFGAIKEAADGLLWLCDPGSGNPLTFLDGRSYRPSPFPGGLFFPTTPGYESRDRLLLQGAHWLAATIVWLLVIGLLQHIGRLIKKKAAEE